MLVLQQQVDKYYQDFDLAMGKGTEYFRQVEKYTDKNQELYQYLKNLYEQHSFLRVQPQPTPKIPKIIHQIWINNRKIPKKIQEYQQTWKELNPSWEYKLWTKEEVKNYTFINKNLEYLFSLPVTLSQKIQVLKYDILYQYGGVIAAPDCICLKPFDVFAHCFDFFAGIFPPMHHTVFPALIVHNSLIGAKPQHPIINKASSLIFDNLTEEIEPNFTGFSPIESTFYSLTNAVISRDTQDNNIDVVMPASYFFPVTPSLTEKIAILFNSKMVANGSFKENSFSRYLHTKETLNDIYSTGIWSLSSPQLRDPNL